MRFDIPSHGPAITPTPSPVKVKHSRRFGFRKPALSSTAVIVASCSVVVIALAALSGFLFWQNSKLKSENKATNSTVSNDQIVKDTISKVGKLYNLPKNDTPTVATIKDITKLKGQAFFSSAKNGDRLLVYTKDKFAILYRESENKIINIGPVQVGDDKSGQANTESQNTGDSQQIGNPGLQ